MDVDADTLQFYAQCTDDIAALAAGLQRPLYAHGASRGLRRALTASQQRRLTAWRSFYIRVRCLLARFAGVASVVEISRRDAEAHERLQRFLFENADLLIRQ